MEDLAQTWTEGKVVYSRDDGKMMIWEVKLEQQNGLVRNNKSFMGAGSFSSIGTGDASGSGSRKRKRVVDEDADSAAGEEEEEEDSCLDEEDNNAGNSQGSLANLSKEMREVYTILQKSTAKGRLLAEQVFLLIIVLSSVEFNYLPLWR